MAEQNNTDALPDDGPWSMTWDKLSNAAGNIAQAVTQKVQDVLPKMPWEMSGSELSSNTANKRTLETYIPPAQSKELAPPTSIGGLFGRLINQESGGKHLDANGNLLTSSAGAKGIAQLMPRTAGDPGFGVTPIQDDSSQEYLRFGKDYLGAMINHFGGDQVKGVAAYNAGPGGVEKAVKQASRKGGDWKDYLPDETRKYIRNIMGV